MAYSYLCRRFGDRSPGLRGEDKVWDSVRQRETTAKRMWLILNALDHSRVSQAEFEANEQKYIKEYLEYQKIQYPYLKQYIESKKV